jgi:pimeloyl-ACP methyl ester carboxylesterase
VSRLSRLDKAISLRSYFGQLKAFHRWGLAQPRDLSVIHQPVLVADGESDRMVPTKNSFELARRLPNADLVVYPAAGHGGIFQFHEQFVAEVLRLPWAVAGVRGGRPTRRCYGSVVTLSAWLSI